MKFISTRNNHHHASPSEALLNGFPPDGGLYVPEHIPTLSVDWETFAERSYQEIAVTILELYFTDFSHQQIVDAVEQAYSQGFNHFQITPMRKVRDEFILELFHGPTVAYKDISMAMAPYLFEYARQKLIPEQKLIIMLTSTGESGKAALEAFRTINDTRILLFYPKEAVSSLQERQLKVHQSHPKKVISILGNFMKVFLHLRNVYLNQDVREQFHQMGWHPTTLNSMNIGRVIPQIVYFYYAYSQLIRQNVIEPGELVDFTVPTGNGTNLVSAYYAKQMGLPIGKIISATTEANSLYNLISNGTFEIHDDIDHSCSPSLDSRLPHNFERLLYYGLECDSTRTSEYIAQLFANNRFEINHSDGYNFSDFIATKVDREATRSQIRWMFENNIYLMDPHTAVASAGSYQVQAVQKETDNIQIIVATSSPYKFHKATLNALKIPTEGRTDRQLLELMENILQYDIPNSLREAIETVDTNTYSITYNELPSFITRWIEEINSDKSLF